MTTIDPHTAPIDTIRDWLAERAGLELHGPPSAHPFPPTLDGAASAMPEGWEWQRGYSVGTGTAISGFKWSARKGSRTESRLHAQVIDTGDEIADRYRLAAACILAEEQANGS